MNNKIRSQIMSGILAGTMLVTAGCGKESECTIPSRHVHKYTRTMNNEIVIEKYLESEKLSNHSFVWNSEYIEITQDDAKLYEFLNSKGLINGIANWSYLYNVMKDNHDYLMFYYEYDTVETYTTTDSEGRTQTHTRTVHHSGWHRNAKDSDNTGAVRLYHHRYYGYRIINNNGEYKLERSPNVDDIRDIIEDYPYYNVDCTTEVYEQFKFKKSQLKELNPDDFDVFKHPKLDDDTLTLRRTR